MGVGMSDDRTIKLGLINAVAEIEQLKKDKAKLREALVKARHSMEPYNGSYYPTIDEACDYADSVLKETSE